MAPIGGVFSRMQAKNASLKTMFLMAGSPVNAATILGKTHRLPHLAQCYVARRSF